MKLCVFFFERKIKINSVVYFHIMYKKFNSCLITWFYFFSISSLFRFGWFEPFPFNVSFIVCDTLFCRCFNCLNRKYTVSSCTPPVYHQRDTWSAELLKMRCTLWFIVNTTRHFVKWTLISCLANKTLRSSHNFHFFQFAYRFCACLLEVLLCFWNFSKNNHGEH